MPKIKQRKDEPTVSFFPYRPALQGQFRTRFYEAACTLVQLFGDQARSEELVSDELAWVEENVSLNPPQRRIYQAAWLLLRDLLRAGWLCRWADGRLEVKPPIAHVDAKEQPLAAKQRVREAMQSERLSRIILAREFIDYAERPRAVGLARLPITSLVADGATLAARLGKIASLQGEERIAHLRQAIRPYLQLVSEGERCVYTGHLLTDIWRYFRYTWATSYYSIPGRTLSYLIRDAAQDNHPVVGIASLSNAPLRIGVRDNASVGQWRLSPQGWYLYGMSKVWVVSGLPSASCVNTSWVVLLVLTLKVFAPLRNWRILPRHLLTV